MRSTGRDSSRASIDSQSRSSRREADGWIHPILKKSELSISQPKAVSGHLLQLQPSLDLTQLSFQLNLVLSSEIGDLSSFVMNGEWAILGKA